MAAHDALLCAHDVITAGTSKHGLYTCAGEKWPSAMSEQRQEAAAAAGGGPIRTDFATEVPKLQRAVVAAGDDPGVVQEEASRQHLSAVTRQGVLQTQRR